MSAMLVQTLQSPVVQRLTAVALLLYACWLAWVSLTPLTTVTHVSDKLVHVAVYAVFMLLATPFTATGSDRRLALLAVAVFLYGVGLEAGQSLVPGRDSSALDIFANGVGVALAACVLLLMRRAAGLRRIR